MQLLAGKEESLLEVPELPQLDAAAIVNHWLHTGGRSLTPHQFDVLMNTFAKCPVPLFLKVIHDVITTTQRPHYDRFSVILRS